MIKTLAKLMLDRHRAEHEASYGDIDAWRRQIEAEAAIRDILFSRGCKVCGDHDIARLVWFRDFDKLMGASCGLMEVVESLGVMCLTHFAEKYPDTGGCNANSVNW